MKNWFFSSEKKVSEKNGAIRLQRILGAWEVWVGDSLQTSPYTNAMWDDACKKASLIKNPENVQKALLLGLGGGGAVKSLHTHFPSIQVTAIEYDPRMAEIARKIKLHSPFPFPHLIVGDVRDIVPILSETFDLVLMDIFEGRKPSSAVADISFLESIRKHLREGALVIVNVSGYRESMRTIAEFFPQGTIWNFQANTLGAFWQKKS